jgi:hypothetical protein
MDKVIQDDPAGKPTDQFAARHVVLNNHQAIKQPFQPVAPPIRFVFPEAPRE